MHTDCCDGIGNLIGFLFNCIADQYGLITAQKHAICRSIVHIFLCHTQGFDTGQSTILNVDNIGRNCQIQIGMVGESTAANAGNTFRKNDLLNLASESVPGK